MTCEFPTLEQIVVIDNTVDLDNLSGAFAFEYWKKTLKIFLATLVTALTMRHQFLT